VTQQVHNRITTAGYIILRLCPGFFNGRKDRHCSHFLFLKLNVYELGLFVDLDKILRQYTL